MNRCRLSIAACCSLLLTACASKPLQDGRYRLDGGALPPTMVLAVKPALKVTAPAWLDDDDFLYTLDYEDPRRMRHYTRSVWLGRPADLLEERLRLALAGSAAPGGDLQLDVRLQDFTQGFSSPTRSEGRVRALVRLVDLKRKAVLAEQLFEQRQPAPSADAPGGAQALAAASDTLIARMLDWTRQQLSSHGSTMP